MDIYVAYAQPSGKQGWLRNPKLFFDNRCILVFTPVSVSAGICTELFKSNMDYQEFEKCLQDELDRLCVPWADTRNPKFCVRVIKGDKQELFMMDITLTGPLPLNVALHTQGVKARKPVKVMIRYGG